ncbi:MAG: hypothetical protein ACMUJM_07060 [bacterium]
MRALSETHTMAQHLIDKGVEIHNPSTIEIGSEVNLDRISGEKVVIFSGCKIFGETTLIMPGALLGYQSPVTIDNCQLGKNVRLEGGAFLKSTFLDRVTIACGAQVREACLLEEESSAAHNVGLKQTILFPFVTLGSLINFCDCLMAGGTSRKDHSEVGSSYVHFNYTPNQDKATASLIGDVSRGVMLNQKPIFLGGQGGIVGPCRIEYGTVAAAGSILRKDCLKPNQLWFCTASTQSKNAGFSPGVYKNIKRQILNNIIYIANLYALRQWYLHIRMLFAGYDKKYEPLYRAALDKISMGIEERIRRLDELLQKMPYSIEHSRNINKGVISEKLIYQKKELLDNWLRIKDRLKESAYMEGDKKLRERFINEVEKKVDLGYIKAIKSLDKGMTKVGSSWLGGIVERIIDEILHLIPSFR